MYLRSFFIAISKGGGEFVEQAVPFLVEFGYCYGEVKEMTLSELDYVLEITLQFLEKRKEALERGK